MWTHKAADLDYPATIAAIDSNQRLDCDPALYVTVTRSGQRLTEGHTTDQILGEIPTQIKVWQRVIVLALQLSEVSSALNSRELVTAYPIDTRVVGCQCLRVDFGVFVAQTKAHGKRLTKGFCRHVDLEVHCS